MTMDQTDTPPAPPRRRMSRGSQLELGLIVAAVGLVGFLTGGWTFEPAYGAALCYGAAVLLGQGLIRDLVILALRRNEPSDPRQAEGLCLCAESSLGVLVILLGSLTLLVGVDQPIRLTSTGLAVALGGILLTGWMIKDHVLVLRHEPDHLNLLMTFKS